MKIITLKEAYEKSSWGPLTGTKRVHPSVDVDNGDGPKPMSEISCEKEGGDWYDVAYVHSPNDAALLAHAYNTLQEMVAAIEHVLIASEDGGDMNDIDWNMLRSALGKANEVESP